MTHDKKPARSDKGLGAHPRKAVAKRPARPSARACRAMAKIDAAAFEPLKITRHRDLAGRQRELFRRLNNTPDAAMMMMINPVLALGEVGVTFSADMRDHVLRALQHSPRLGQRRKILEQSLTEALGEAPQPNNAKWLATTVFQKLKIKAKVTRGRTPAYRPPVTQPMLERLSRRRPAGTWKKAPPERTRRMSRLVLKPWQPSMRRLDLDAPVSDLPAAKVAPKTLSLQSLAFYKDDHPLARDLLELGIIAQQSYPIHTGATYRDIRAGRKPNSFRAWISSIRFGAD